MKDIKAKGATSPFPTAAAFVADELRMLVDLRDAGVLSAEGFASQKAMLLYAPRVR